MSQDALTAAQTGGNANPNNVEIYYLDIPPRTIQQKEVFANNISATRRGIIVETEGVVFKDIVITGTTGVFPGKRASDTNKKPNFNDFTSAPKPAEGVDSQTGRSRAANVKTISGFEEFMRLRQFFLKYAFDKVNTNGARFLVFLNEKDDQYLIVEPMEFTMDRNARSPMTYDYRIVLKAIGTLGSVFSQSVIDKEDPNSLFNFLEDVGNVSANVSATIATGRAVINQSRRLLERFSQALDQTFIDPLRQTQFAMEDLSDGISTVLSLPEVLSRNATDAVLNVRDSLSEVGVALGLSAGFQAANSSEGRATDAADITNTKSIARQIQNDSRVPVPRSSLETLRATTNDLSNNLADFTGLGDPLFNSINGRIVTNPAPPLKIVSDDEFLLLGTLAKLSNSMNTALASNALFESDAEAAFSQAERQFEIPNLKQNQQIQINKPEAVKEITILRNDTLERIAQRELGNALRWLDIVVLNNLKPPYISPDGGDGVKKPGEKLLVGVD